MQVNARSNISKVNIRSRPNIQLAHSHNKHYNRKTSAYLQENSTGFIAHWAVLTEVIWSCRCSPDVFSYVVGSCLAGALCCAILGRHDSIINSGKERGGDKNDQNSAQAWSADRLKCHQKRLTRR
jgi:hypothetical protein